MYVFRQYYFNPFTFCCRCLFVIFSITKNLINSYINMADRGNHQRTSAIPAALECALCLDVFNDPRNLPCGHTFCLECLSRFVDKSKNRKKSTSSLECSLCKRPWEVPQDGVTALPKN